MAWEVRLPFFGFCTAYQELFHTLLTENPLFGQKGVFKVLDEIFLLPVFQVRDLEISFIQANSSYYFLL